MNTQPEALRLADLIRSRYGNDINDDAADELRRLHELVEHLQLTIFGFETKLATRSYEIQIDDLKKEVRRLHEVNQELLEALEEAIELFVVASTGGGVNFWMAAKDLRKIHNKATGYEE